jgi:CspA family cold shock protein
MAMGTVKWFNNAKGYGFVIADAGGEDLFAHYSSIQMDGYKTLKAGQSVEFDIEQGPKGLHAVNIKAFEPHAAKSAPESSQSERTSNSEERIAKAAFSSASPRTEYAESR